MWEIINSIRGKNKRQIKPNFLIDNNRITSRRVIAHEFNKYFVSLAATLMSMKHTQMTVILDLTHYRHSLTTSHKCALLVYSLVTVI